MLGWRRGRGDPWRKETVLKVTLNSEKIFTANETALNGKRLDKLN